MTTCTFKTLQDSIFKIKCIDAIAFNIEDLDYLL